MGKDCWVDWVRVLEGGGEATFLLVALVPRGVRNSQGDTSRTCKRQDADMAVEDLSYTSCQ